MKILKRIARWLGMPEYIEVWVTPNKTVSYFIPTMTGSFPSGRPVTVSEPDYLNMRREIWVMP